MGESWVLDDLKIPDEVKEVLRNFTLRIRERFSDVQVYLFGSYARGDWLHDSDIDLIIVSKAFEGLDISKRYSLVRRMLPATVSVELLLYTPDEFRNVKHSVIIGDAERYWIKLL